MFNGLDMNLGNLSRLSSAKSRSISPENFMGEKGQHIWMTPIGQWRNTILRIYWEDNETPSVECPVGDFFCCGWQQYFQISSLPVCVNPGSGLNCYWSMPFRKRCKITLDNRDEKPVTVYYQIDYTLTEVSEDCAYFHAQFRRTNPLPYKSDYTILDGIKGQGQYVGTYMAWGVHNNGWWGEGGRYLPLQDDISSVAFWYQDLPCAPFPKLPDKDYLEII